MSECYIVATVAGVHMYGQSKPYMSKNGAIKEYEKVSKRYPNDDVRILKANWVDVDFDYKK